MKPQRGMLAPALLLVLILAVTGALLARRAAVSTENLARSARTAHALRLARDALLGYAASYRGPLHPNADFGYLPCPDVDGDGSADTCGLKNNNSLGRLPFLTLGLPDLRDGDGECLWYAVAGSFKNNPKPDVLNWDSIGRFRLVDVGGAALTLAGDQSGLAAALIIAPGAPLPGQARQSGSGRCGELSTAAAANYLESLTVAADAAVLDVRFSPDATHNDRLATLTTGDLYAQLKANPHFAPHLQQVFSAVADCLTSLPAPAAIESAGLVQLGRLPSLTALPGACHAADMTDAVANWSETLRYLRCADRSACLAGCRGALLFGGERIPPGQRRVSTADKQLSSNYLEAATLAAVAANRLAAPPSTFTIPFAARKAIASADVAVCIP